MTGADHRGHRVWSIPHLRRAILAELYDDDPASNSLLGCLTLSRDSFPDAVAIQYYEVVYKRYAQRDVTLVVPPVGGQSCVGRDLWRDSRQRLTLTTKEGLDIYRHSVRLMNVRGATPFCVNRPGGLMHFLEEFPLLQEWSQDYVIFTRRQVQGRWEGRLLAAGGTNESVFRPCALP